MEQSMRELREAAIAYTSQYSESNVTQGSGWRAIPPLKDGGFLAHIFQHEKTLTVSAEITGVGFLSVVFNGKKVHSCEDDHHIVEEVIRTLKENVIRLRESSGSSHQVELG